MKNILDVREDKVDIAGKQWDDDLVAQLVAKKILQFQKCVSFWEPLLHRGRVYENRYEGKIFDDHQVEVYEEVEDKIVVEPPIAKAPVRALVGSAIQSRRSGQVVTERSAGAGAEDNSKELEVLSAVLKDMETKTQENYRITEAMESALVSCYWNVLLYDKDRPSRNGDGVRYRMTKLPWSSCVFGPATAREVDGSDIKELFFFDYRTKADLIDNFPDMEKQIVDHFGNEDTVDSRLLSSVSQWESGLTADEKDTMFDVIKHASEATRGSSGMVRVIQHLFPIKRMEEVWINMFDDSGEDFEVRPPEWDDARWEKWASDNRQRYAGPYERETITLWMTVFTTSGLVLANEKHWFQEGGRLPCSFWLGKVSAGKPTGVMADISDDVLSNAVAEVEALDDMRKGSGRLLLAREGAITNMGELASEANKAFGLGMVSKDFPGTTGDAVHEMVRTPNTAWKSYAEWRQASIINNTRINEAMQGVHAGRQSAIAKTTEITQALGVNAVYIDSFNRCWERHQNLKLELVPYFYDVHETLEVMDEKTGDMMQVEVNAPAGYDAEGNIASVINDLSGHKYRFKLSPVDDSPTAKIRYDQDALDIINSAGGPLLSADPSGTIFSSFLAAQQNPVLRDVGKRMLEQAQQASQAQAAAEQQKDSIDATVKLSKAKADLTRAAKHGVILNYRAQDLADFPALYDLYLQMQQFFEQKANADMAEVQQQIAPPAPMEAGGVEQ